MESLYLALLTPRGAAFAVSRRGRLLALAACAAGGFCYALALPPANLAPLIMLSLTPLLVVSFVYRPLFSLLAGFVWGWCWSICSYFFLREIHPAVPWLLASAISAWTAVYGLLISLCSRRLLFGPGGVNLTVAAREEICRRGFPAGRLCRWIFVSALLFTLLEWTRCRLFVWNDFSVVLWKYPLLMQGAAIGGRYGISFLLTLTACAVPALVCRHRRPAAAVLAVLWAAVLIYGFCRLRQQPAGAVHRWRVGLVQANLPQQRVITGRDQIVASVDAYADLTEQLPASETVLWPESAVPLPFRAQHSGAAYFRYRASRAGKASPLLLGTLEYDADGAMTNGALLLLPGGRIAGKYDKRHLVPYGEYVPFRGLIPESWQRYFSMGRDLRPGKSAAPLPVAPGVRAGVLICYEGVFSYICRESALAGANVLTALSNDVWYPVSSEPEQHLANAVLRCVETGLPMVRCANNGGSLVIDARGRIGSCIGGPGHELAREKASGVVTVPVEAEPRRTCYTEYGDRWLALAALAALGMLWERKKKDVDICTK